MAVGGPNLPQPEAAFIAGRKYRLPAQIEATRQKLKMLIREAKRYEMYELLTNEEWHSDI